MFNLKPQSGIPLYQQFMEEVRHRISSGQLKPGDELPSIRELSQINAVNPMTFSKAYSLLQKEGLLVHQRGKPMTVAKSHHRKNRKERIAHLQPVLDQLADSAGQLELTTEDLVSAIRATMEKKND